MGSSVQGTHPGENEVIHWVTKAFGTSWVGTRNESSIKSEFLLHSKAFESEHTLEPFVCQMGRGNLVEKMHSRCGKKKCLWACNVRPVCCDAWMLVTSWALKSQSGIFPSHSLGIKLDVKGKVFRKIKSENISFSARTLCDSLLLCVHEGLQKYSPLLALKGVVVIFFVSVPSV